MMLEGAAEGEGEVEGGGEVERAGEVEGVGTVLAMILGWGLLAQTEVG